MAFDAPVDRFGSARRIPYMDRGLEQPSLLSAKEEVDQYVDEARSHYDVMAKMPQDKRVDYFKNVLKSQGYGGEDDSLTTEQHAARFMNLVNRTPAADSKAASLGHTDRDPSLGSSDAYLFFGRGLRKSLLSK